MDTNQLVPGEGSEFGPSRRYRVTARDIRRFAQATGERLPEPLDREAVGGGGQGLLRAPLLFCQSLMYDDVPMDELLPDGSPKELNVDVPAERTVGGGSEFEIFGPVFEGDDLTVASRVKSVFNKEGRSGRLFFIVVETVFTNQDGQLTARELATYIKR